MRRVLLIVLALAMALVPSMAHATAAAPVVTDDGIGRDVLVINHFGDPAKGRAICSAQGQFLDTNGNGITDSIRGRGACQESPKGVAKFRLTSVRLQVFYAETWLDVVVRSADAVSGPQPSYVVAFTPSTPFCPPPNNIGLLYRVANHAVIRWTDNTLSYRTIFSHHFEAFAARGTQLC